jgi:hypothetical protein
MVAARKTKERYSNAALMDVFGSIGASPTAIVRWKQQWRDTSGKVEVSSFHSAVVLLRQYEIDPLYYQFISYTDGIMSPSLHYIVFYKMEHEVIFKLTSGIT